MLLQAIQQTTWERAPDSIDALESGRIVLFPNLPFELSESERRFLSPSCLREGTKNISYRPATRTLAGARVDKPEREEMMSMIARFHSHAVSLVSALCAGYGDRIVPGFASFRPAEISSRAVPLRKDDTRLHIDAFPSRPLQGRRILRIFTNVHPSAARVWRTGEPFEALAGRFARQVRPPLPGSAWLLQTIRITKDRRTPYDHWMLGIHDRMKADDAYQRECPQQTLEFPPGATWACYTDLLPHAAMSGQFAFEQTFHVPVDVMRRPDRSPLRVLEAITGRKLV